MTPKEKALELINKYEFTYIKFANSPNVIKQCALMAVDEVLSVFNDTNGSDVRLYYWQEVRQEIEKM